MFLLIAHEILEPVRESYFDGEDVLQLFESKTKLRQLKQGNRDVTDY